MIVGGAVAVIALLLGFAAWRLLWRDFGALRRSQRTARAALAEVAQKHPEAAALALGALEASALPGDPTAEELQRGPG